MVERRADAEGRAEAAAGAKRKTRTPHSDVGKKHDIRYTDTVVDRILEMKKGSCAAVSRKGWGPKTRQKISDITDFQKKEFWK